MKTLYLVRHAKSSWADPGLADRDRPLNRRGMRNGPMMAERLRAKGVRFDQMITSPVKRAQETLRFFIDGLGVSKSKVRVEEALYGASVDQWLRLIQQLDESWTTAMMVGHNPTITELAHALGRSDISNVPTCGILACEYDGDYWANFGDDPKQVFVDFDYPKRVVE
ncbi:MAG: 2,3-bisphosphoglycerate-dependent phosphoglycerate mutase [Verrucomicrobia subdivision 3 bacterium]|nr:2,3-bisphosphoglycerate-dependent phosphoglycerate mutase [Limisphaerales bacterium]MCS1413393.1 2,3-bisphosphoglycerate-dependent phosphoglycerate mutase [Limisphaerales bacterium]